MIHHKQVKLKNSTYELYDTAEAIVKVFKHKVVIQFKANQPIRANSVDEAKRLANERISNFIANLNLEGIKTPYKQISRHYAIVGTAIAEKRVRERKKLLILDPIDQKPRILIDNSEKSNRLAHLENVHIDHNQEDADKEIQFLKDLVTKESYLPSQTKAILDQLLITNAQSNMRIVDLITALEKIREVLERRI